MSNYDNLLKLIEIPEVEKEEFKKIIKEFREKYIIRPKNIIHKLFENNDTYKTRLIKKHEASDLIFDVREKAWKDFLVEESDFNTQVLKYISSKLSTPKRIIDILIKEKILGKTGDELVSSIREVCGEYAGRISPYIYELSLSNTNSRRSRAGSTFEALIYELYEILGFSYDSQTKVGQAVFQDLGLGKKVDSILPGIKEFEERRTKVIIGTMKTTLRERWQEVAEEIERTKVPSIYLLTVDEEIAVNKINEMSKHNIILVAYKKIAESPALKGFKTVISFEDYFFREIPDIMKFWNK